MIGILAKKLDQELLAGAVALSQSKTPCCLFTNVPMPSDVPSLFPVLQPLRAYHFEGILVSSDLSTTEMLIKLVRPQKKFFYIRSFEWTYLDQCNYSYLRYIYQNDNLELIAANEKIYKTIKDLFKEPSMIIKDWKLGELI